VTPRFIGLDFGTTNSSVAVLSETDRTPELCAFSDNAGSTTTTFRSVIFFEEERVDHRVVTRSVAGPEAIARYLARGGESNVRFIQSLKSYLASALFTSTNVFGKTFTLEDLITVILRGIRHSGVDRLGSPENELRGVVVGRPVRFANSDGEADETLALKRATEALARAGFLDVRFEYEPVGAACFYERSLDHDELVLIGDFGGGTSDFCLMRVGPGHRNATGNARILGTEGVGLAGDAFDSEIVQAIVSPKLGMGSEYASYLDGKVLPVPPWIYAKLRRWHHLSFLKSRDTLRFLHDIRAQSLAPERFDALLHLIEYDLGFPLHRAVEGCKVALSASDIAQLTFMDSPVEIDESIARTAFNQWISGSLDSIRGCVDRLMSKAKVQASDVDRVFLTGGSSLVPVVRDIFAQRFGKEKLRGGNELTSVAQGLALRASM
jgi:hypothetical chaperone protein